MPSVSNSSAALMKHAEEDDSGSTDDDSESGPETVWDDHETAWKYLLRAEAGHESPVFFEHLRVATDGGMSKITGTKDSETDKLWSFTRYLGAASVLVSCVLNSFFIFHVCYKTFTKKKLPEDYLLTTEIKGSLARVFGQELGEMNSFAVLSMLESLILVLLWMKLFYSLCVICSGPGWKRWQQVQSLFFEQLTLLSVFSAMQLLFFVTPKVLVANLMSVITGVERPDYCHALRMLLFAVICFVIGFDAFLVKFRQCAQHFIVDKNEFTFEEFYGSVMLLKQILGVVQLDWLMRRRVYVFVFKGPNEKLTDEALVKMDVWNSWAAKTIWDKYPTVMDRIAMLATFSDEDFQHVVLLNDSKQE